MINLNQDQKDYIREAHKNGVIFREMVKVLSKDGVTNGSGKLSHQDISTYCVKKMGLRRKAKYRKRYRPKPANTNVDLLKNKVQYHIVEIAELVLASQLGKDEKQKVLQALFKWVLLDWSVMFGG